MGRPMYKKGVNRFMKKRESGVLTIEASLVLTLTLLVILFLFSFARLYSAQSMVSHAVLQSSDAVAMESYLRETTFNGDPQDVAKLANKITGSSTVTEDSFVSLRSADIPNIVQSKFVTAISETESQADTILKKLGVKDGVSGVDFSSSRIDLNNNEVIVLADYTVELQFPLFGMKELELTKAAKAKTFGEILFEIVTRAEDPKMGTASGGGKYMLGTEIEISATANYGYKFVKWTDGSTENPRRVTVAGPQEYVAVFIQDEFGVNLVSNPADGGSVSGAGVYKYLESATISATPAPGYSFNRWAIYQHNDGKTRIAYDATTSLTVDQTYTCTAYYTPNTYNVKVRTEGAGGGATLTYKGSTKTSVSAKYKESFTLSAPYIAGYEFLGWKEDGGAIFTTSSTVTMQVPPKNVTYVACYKSTIVTVYFYGYGNVLYATRTIHSGNALGGNMPGNPQHLGSIFNGWRNFNSGTVVRGDTHVYSDWRGCTHHRDARCGHTHYLPSNPRIPHSGGRKAIYYGQCIVCADCGIPKYRRGASTATWDGVLDYYYGCSERITSGVFCFHHSGCVDLWDDLPIYDIHK